MGVLRGGKVFQARCPGSRNARNSRFAEPVSRSFPGAINLSANRLTSPPAQSDCRPGNTGKQASGMPSETNGVTEMPSTKNTARAPRSAAHAAPAPGQASGTGPAPGDPAAAVHAALTANPGATTAVIATAAGIGRPAARDALTALETAGVVTRTKGGKPGIP